LCLVSALSVASGIAPMPICSVAPVWNINQIQLYVKKRDIWHESYDQQKRRGTVLDERGHVLADLHLHIGRLLALCALHSIVDNTIM
jgi:hypothetical protein